MEDETQHQQHERAAESDADGASTHSESSRLTPAIFEVRASS
jgi:hypothetical protein